MTRKKFKDRAGQWHAKLEDVPARRDLRPFQAVGAKWLQRTDERGPLNSLLADDMGLGKTAQVIESINPMPATARVLIVCPAGLRLNWLRELAIWLSSERRAEIAKRYIPSQCPIVIVSVDSLTKFEVQIRRQHWDMIVLDEAHTIRNPKTIRGGQVIGDDSTMPLDAERKIAMTGTPMPNRPIEIWPILRFLGCGLSFKAFGELYCGGGSFMGSSRTDELRALLSRYMLRRKKADVLTELPAKTRQIVRIAPAGGVRACAAAEIKWEKQVEDIERFGGKVKMKEIEALRQKTALAKLALPEVQAIIREAVECYGKVVIFAAHHCAVDAAAKILTDAGIEALKYTGAMTTDERQRAVDRFQNWEGRMGFIGTIGAAGVGITLTAASTVIFIEEDFTPGMTDQAEDRCHRYGQRNAVLVRHIVIEGSYDQRALEIQVTKEQVISRVL